MADSGPDKFDASFFAEMEKELTLIRSRETQFSRVGWTLGVVHLISVLIAGTYFIRATLSIEFSAFDELLYARFTAASFLFVSLISLLVAVLLHFRADKLRNVLILYPLFCKEKDAALRLQFGADLTQVLLDSGGSKRLSYLKGIEDGKKEALTYRFVGPPVTVLSGK